MNPYTADIDLCLEIGKDFCVRSRCFPVSSSGDSYLIAAEKYDELLIEALRLRLDKHIELCRVDSATLEYQIKLIAGNTSKEQKNGRMSDLVQSEIAVGDDSSVEELRKKSQAEPVVKLVNEIIDQAIAEGATDIHLEPSESRLKVRYRKDGMLRDSLNLPKWIQAPLVSRIKILAELDIAEKRLPHDGRIKWVSNGETIDMRISTLPTQSGEKVVIRILKHTFYVSELDALGVPPDILQALRRIIHKPQGMFFVTGPTGSGKTSTLYAALREILHKDINISTIEDPIEYRMEGANQVQVNEKAGLTFASALRSLLRQDPDVILVGEIRDEETAAIAVQAAQTGHLVFSTLHTNDAVSAITRLKDLKIKPFLISSAVLGILAQRLVRKICPECGREGPPEQDEKAALPNLPDVCPITSGCSRCGHTGYNGRTGIFELIQFTNTIKDAVLKEESEQKISELAGLRLLIHDGVDKVKSGITSPTELLRVAMTEG
jgi:type II secretory ATPase GspE/PulE/Tfp pilus assembly ATPase PilB-like protein